MNHSPLVDTSNLITKAIGIVGLRSLASHLGVTYQAIQKWEANDRLPRTEWTGETNYAEKIQALTNGAITKQELLDMRSTRVAA